MTETEIIERAIDPVAGDRFEWNGQVCEVKDVADIHNVGVIVHYTFTAYGKTTSLSEFLRVWPTRVRKTIAGGAVFIPSNNVIGATESRLTPDIHYKHQLRTTP